MIEFVPTRKRHLRVIEQNLLPGDVAELEATGKSVSYALYESFYKSRECLTIMIDGRASAVFGVGVFPEYPTVGVPWLLCTDQIKGKELSLMKSAKTVIELWSRDYDLMTNIVHDANESAKGLIETLGFKFPDEFDLVINPVTGEPFRVFLKENT